MYTQLSDNYRLTGHYLYKKQGAAFIHCAITPGSVRSLEQAIAWYLNRPEACIHCDAEATVQRGDDQYCDNCYDQLMDNGASWSDNWM